VHAAELALDVQVPVAVSLSVLRDDAGANQIAGGLPFEAFTNRGTHFREFSLRLALERQSRRLQCIGYGRPQAGNCHDEGAKKALSNHRFAHPKTPVGRGDVSMLRAQHFRRPFCIK
jgi:hypothetical protein